MPVPPTCPVAWKLPDPSTAPMSGRLKLHVPVSWTLPPFVVLPKTWKAVGGGTVPLFTTIVGLAGLIDSEVKVGWPLERLWGASLPPSSRCEPPFVPLPSPPPSAPKPDPPELPQPPHTAAVRAAPIVRRVARRIVYLAGVVTPRS